MKRSLKILSFLCAVAIAVSSFSGCGLAFFKAPKIEVRDAHSEMISGETQILNVYNAKTNKKISGYLVFASSDPSVVSVDQTGKIEAISQGTATIYIQHTENKLRTEFMVNVTYDVIYAPRYHAEHCYSPIEGDMYLFWGQKNYEKRVGNWDVLKVASIIFTKGAGDYVFSDAFEHTKVVGEEILLLSDWGNKDIMLDKSVLTRDLLNFIPEKYKASKIDLSGAIIEIKTILSDQIDSYQNTLRLSKLPNDMEYRVYVSCDYNIVKVDNYYSLGTLKGPSQLTSDILSGNVSSVLDSYTYLETEYEIVNIKNVSIVIEARNK